MGSVELSDYNNVLEEKSATQFTEVRDYVGYYIYISSIQVTNSNISYLGIIPGTTIAYQDAGLNNELGEFDSLDSYVGKYVSIDKYIYITTDNYGGFNIIPGTTPAYMLWNFDALVDAIKNHIGTTIGANANQRSNVVLVTNTNYNKLGIVLQPYMEMMEMSYLLLVILYCSIILVLMFVLIS